MGWWVCYWGVMPSSCTIHHSRQPTRKLHLRQREWVYTPTMQSYHNFMNKRTIVVKLCQPVLFRCHMWNESWCQALMEFQLVILHLFYFKVQPVPQTPSVIIVVVNVAWCHLLQAVFNPNHSHNKHVLHVATPIPWPLLLTLLTPIPPPLPAPNHSSTTWLDSMSPCRHPGHLPHMPWTHHILLHLLLCPCRHRTNTQLIKPLIIMIKKLLMVAVVLVLMQLMMMIIMMKVVNEVEVLVEVVVVGRRRSKWLGGEVWAVKVLILIIMMIMKKIIIPLIPVEFHLSRCLIDITVVIIHHTHHDRLLRKQNPWQVNHRNTIIRTNSNSNNKKITRV